MKKLIHFFIFFILLNNSSYSKDLLSLGLEVNSFSQLKEKRTIFFKNSKFFYPEKDFNDKDINNKTINTNYTSNIPNVVYQFCCDSNSDASAFFVSKLNDASNKLTNLSDKQVLELDNTAQPIKLAIFKKTKLDKFLYITDNNELILVSRKAMNDGGAEYLISKKNIQKKYSIRTLENDLFKSSKFKQNLSDDGVIALNKNTISLASLNTAVILDMKNDRALVMEKKPGNIKIVLANRNLKKVFYFGIWDGQRNLDEANQFLKKSVLNIMPPVYNNLFKSGKTLTSERMPNYNFEDINSLVLKLENLNKKLLFDIKKKEDKFNQIVNAKLEEEKKKQEQLKQKKADEEFQRYQAEQKRIAAEKEALLEKKRQEQEALRQEALAAKRMEYVKYGAYIVVAILAFIAAIYFKIFDVLNKVFKNIFAKKKRFSNLGEDQKGKGKGKKDFNNDFIRRFCYPGKLYITLCSLLYCLVLIVIPFNSFYMGNFLTGVLTLVYLSVVIFCVCIKKDFFNGGGEGMFVLKTVVLLFVAPLVFVYNFSATISKGPPDLLFHEYHKGKTYCVYGLEKVDAERFGGRCPTHKTW